MVLLFLVILFKPRRPTHSPRGQPGPVSSAPRGLPPIPPQLPLRPHSGPAPHCPCRPRWAPHRPPKPLLFAPSGDPLPRAGPPARLLPAVAPLLLPATASDANRGPTPRTEVPPPASTASTARRPAHRRSSAHGAAAPPPSPPQPPPHSGTGTGTPFISSGSGPARRAQPIAAPRPFPLHPIAAHPFNPPPAGPDPAAAAQGEARWEAEEAPSRPVLLLCRGAPPGELPARAVLAARGRWELRCFLALGE